MNWGLDTSALLRIVTKEPPELALRVAARIESILEAGETVSVSDLAVFEAYYALQHSYRMTKANAIADLLALSRQPGFKFSETAVAALSEPNAATMSPGLVDRMLAGVNVKRTRLARGIPMGSDLEFIDEVTMLRAFEGRVSL